MPGVTTLSALILGREGMSNPENAKSFLSNVMGRTDNYLSLLHNDTLGGLSKFLPQPPSFTAPQVRGQGAASQGFVRHHGLDSPGTPKRHVRRGNIAVGLRADNPGPHAGDPDLRSVQPSVAWRTCDIPLVSQKFPE